MHRPSLAGSSRVACVERLIAASMAPWRLDSAINLERADGSCVGSGLRRAERCPGAASLGLFDDSRRFDLAILDCVESVIKTPLQLAQQPVV